MSAMTGPQHFLEAEALTELAKGYAYDAPEVPSIIARAQVHATLAVAAASALPAWNLEGRTPDEWVQTLTPAKVADRG